jgi:hypothetical protein
MIMDFRFRTDPASVAALSWFPANRCTWIELASSENRGGGQGGGRLDLLAAERAASKAQSVRRPMLSSVSRAAGSGGGSRKQGANSHGRTDQRPIGDDLVFPPDNHPAVLGDDAVHLQITGQRLPPAAQRRSPTR